MPTTKTVIGTFDNSSNLDIFQSLGQGGQVICGMDYTGAIYPAQSPIVEDSLTAIDVTTPQTISALAGTTSMFNVGIFMESYGTGAGGTTCIATISFTNVQNNVKTVVLTLLGPTDNIQQENYVLMALGGTTISVTTAFSGAAFPYDVAVSIARTP